MPPGTSPCYYLVYCTQTTTSHFTSTPTGLFAVSFSHLTSASTATPTIILHCKPHQSTILTSTYFSCLYGSTGSQDCDQSTLNLDLIYSTRLHSIPPSLIILPRLFCNRQSARTRIVDTYTHPLAACSPPCPSGAVAPTAALDDLLDHTMPRTCRTRL